MEAREVGLSKEEKIMFSILGIVLIIAIGVLIINGFSNNERELVEKTPTKNVEQSEETTTDTKNEETLKESETITEVSNNTNNTTHKKVTYLSKPTEDKKEDTTPVSWVVNENIVTEAYSGEEIVINDIVIDSNNKKSHAAVTVRKYENDAYNIVEVTNNRFVATPGIYVYYYTHDSVTKEIMLKVYDKLNIESLEVSQINDTDEYYLNEEEMNSLKENNEQTQISFDENYTLTLIKKSDYNKVAITLKTDFVANTLELDTKGIQVLDTKIDEVNGESTITLLVDTSIIKGTKDIHLTINDMLYSFKLNVTVEEYKEEETNPEEDEEQKDNDEDAENQEQEGENNKQEEEQQPDPGEEFQPEQPDQNENNNTNQISEESVAEEIVTNVETTLQVLA